MGVSISIQFHMSVTLIFGCSIPLSIHNNRHDYSNVYDIIQTVFNGINMDIIHEEYCDLSGGINIPNTPYSIKVYINGEMVSAFIELKSIQYMIQEFHVHIECPTDGEVTNFQKYLRKYGIKYPYSMYMLIQR